MALVLLHQGRRMVEEDMHLVVVEGMKTVGMAAVAVDKAAVVEDMLPTDVRHMVVDMDSATEEDIVDMVAGVDMEAAEALHMIVGFEDMGCAMIEAGDIVDMVEGNLLDDQ